MCLILYLYKQFLRLGQNLLLSYSLLWEDNIFHSHTNNMTVELYQQHMINRNGWATATEIEAAANLFGLNINIWLQHSSHCTLSSFNASSPTCIDILLSRNHFSPLKRVPPNTDNTVVSNHVNSDHVPSFSCLDV